MVPAREKKGKDGPHDQLLPYSKATHTASPSYTVTAVAFCVPLQHSRVMPSVVGQQEPVKPRLAHSSCAEHSLPLSLQHSRIMPSMAGQQKPGKPTHPSCAEHWQLQQETRTHQGGSTVQHDAIRSGTTVAFHPSAQRNGEAQHVRRRMSWARTTDTSKGIQMRRARKHKSVRPQWFTNIAQRNGEGSTRAQTDVLGKNDRHQRRGSR